jgi:hypothetical protein
VEKIKGGSIITICGIHGRFIVPSDTIKPMDKIEMSWIHRYH